MFVVLGLWMIHYRRRRLHEDYRTQGTIVGTGGLRHRDEGIKIKWRNSGPQDPDGDEGRIGGRWMRVEYRDADGRQQTRTLLDSTRNRQEGQSVDLLVDREAPQDVLVNESVGGLITAMIFVALGSIVLAVFTYAWLSGHLTF